MENSGAIDAFFANIRSHALCLCVCVCIHEFSHLDFHNLYMIYDDIYLIIIHMAFVMISMSLFLSFLSPSLCRWVDFFQSKNEKPVSKSDAWDFATLIGAQYIETSSRANVSASAVTISLNTDNIFEHCRCN